MSNYHPRPGSTRHSLAAVTLGAVVFAGCTAPRPHLDEQVGARVFRDHGVTCLGDPPCDVPRSVFVDQAIGGEWVWYDLEEVVRPVRARRLHEESDVSLAVRLLVSEIGADRLVENRNAMLEAAAILWTVDNRLTPEVYDPLGLGTEPFPGCGPDRGFGACANPAEYLGMGTWRALTPDAGFDPDLLEAAVDVAVAAYWLHAEGLAADLTHGATSYVHRCGGLGYGEPTWRCDAHLGRPEYDLPGAEPHTGPAVFKAPAVFLADRGHYALRATLQVDYDPL